MILLKSLVSDPITVKTPKRALLLNFSAVARFCLYEIIILLENYSTGGGASTSRVMSDTALLLKQLSAWNRIIREKVIVTELVNKFSICM
jgi:hypothetical protein